ncbi:virulence factor [Burkholderia sp. Ax-1719]|uniref:virulence factor n=1 Tax=Burkholderia sp. Ax-1719 TaxID=2608334 RepID=UPI001420F401|nr:virulence factor [Burkholderia sp. Ax-1719]NIE66027.1 virulence factor [Burkholderia sp. Ax-1719]
MSTLFGTWPRRCGLAIAVMALASVLMLILMVYEDRAIPAMLTMGEVMKRLVILPGLLALAVFLLTAAFAPMTAQAAVPGESVSSSETGNSGKLFAAQVVGLEWLNPLQRRDYPTEWQILWTLGLVTPNKHDDMVSTNPQKYGALRAVLAVADGVRGQETFDGFYQKYVDTLLLLFGDRYAMNGKYFYTVQPKDKKLWRELAGVHVEFAIPAGRLDPVEAQSYLRDRMKLFFEIGSKSSPDLWSKDTPPDVHVTPGGANAGFTSLNKALDYLQANPDKSVWVMNWDAPSFPPKDSQINENMVLLILAGPDMKTDRAPLAWIGKASSGNVKDFEAKAGTTRAVEAWKATIEGAAHNANVPASKINYVIHDAGKGSDAASSRIGSLGRTLTETLPEFDFQKQTFNTPGLLGDMGAGTALTDVVLAIGRANHLGETVLVAGTTNAEHPVAVVVVPPAQPLPIDPNADWYRARGENNAYLPWWGRRYDTKYNQQGWSW